MYDFISHSVFVSLYKLNLLNACRIKVIKQGLEWISGNIKHQPARVTRPLPNTQNA